MKKYISISIIIAIVFIVVIVIVKQPKKKEEKIVESESAMNSENVSIEQNVLLEENNDVENIKQNIGFSGQSDIYDVHEEDDIKVLEVKPSIKVMVSYSGIIKNGKFSLGEAKEIFEKNYSNHGGIYIVENSRNKLLNMLDSKMFNNKYFVDENGYLSVKEFNKEQTANDELLVKYINSSFEYTIDISSTCYIVDDVTGKIMDYNFEDMDKYQAYEYFSDSNRMILFLTENKNNLISDDEIIENALSVMNI